MGYREDVEVIRRFNESWGRRDIDGVLACADADMEFDWSESISPFKGVYSGRDGVTRFYEELSETFSDFTPTIGDPIDCGDGRIVTPTTVNGHARTSGIEVAAHGAMLWELRAGKIRHAKVFQDVDDALAALERSQ